MSETTHGATLRGMPDLHLTIVYESDPDSDWIVASIPEVPGAHSQGRTREEAREMVLDALAGLNEIRAREREPLGESLALGKPCLAASGTALEEAGGDLCRYFDPEDVGDAHRAIAALLDTPGAIAAWQADISARYQPRDWSAAASAILDLAA